MKTVFTLVQLIVPTIVFVVLSLLYPLCKKKERVALHAGLIWILGLSGALWVFRALYEVGASKLRVVMVMGLMMAVPALFTYALADENHYSQFFVEECESGNGRMKTLGHAAIVWVCLMALSWVLRIAHTNDG